VSSPCPVSGQGCPILVAWNPTHLSDKWTVLSSGEDISKQGVFMQKPSNKLLGAKVDTSPSTWVQTERAAHEAWARLTVKSPRSAALMHHLVARMGHQNAVVVSQKTLAKLMGCNERTVRRAVSDLVTDRWIQAVKLGSAGTINAYVVNDQVAWGQPRDHRPALSVFSAYVVADAADQDALTLEHRELRRLPLIYPPETAHAVGAGERGAQISLPTLEPVIEGRHVPEEAFDPETGEVIENRQKRLI